MPRVLLHTCCGPCAGHAVEELRRLGHDVTLCFSNSNLAPPEEYARRLEAARQLSENLHAPLIEDPPDHAAWLEAVRGLESAPEGGERCRRCFEFSLRRVHRLAKQEGFDAFATTLTNSPHKSVPMIFAIGAEIDASRFLAIDFNKRAGFQRSATLAKACGLYRQNYCGCEFSQMQNDRKQKMV